MGKYWHNLTLNQKVSLISLLLLLFVVPAAVILVLNPKIPLFSRAQTPVTPPDPDVLPGDINGDRVVNIQDYILLSNSFGNSNIDPSVDLDDNGTVNIQDYIILSNNFGRTA